MTESLILVFSFQELGANAANFFAVAVTVFLIGIGLTGALLPFIPGTLFILAGGIVYRLWLGPESGLTWIAVGVLGALSAIAFLIDWAATAAGAKWFGSSGWGVAGAIIGGLVGGLFFNIFGLLFGPFIGAFALEVFMADRKIGAATQSTWGAFIGTVLGIMGKGVVTVAMVALMWFDINRWEW